MNDLTVKAERITLNDRRTFRLTRGPYLLGYYPTADQLIAALPGHGVRPPEIEIVVSNEREVLLPDGTRRFTRDGITVEIDPLFGLDDDRAT